MLSNSLNALGSQYDIYLNKKSKNDYKKHERKLLIKEVKSGSIIIDLVGMVMPLITEINSIIEFGEYLKTSFNFFLNKGKSDYQYSKKDCQDIRSIVDATAKDGNNAKVNINVYGYNNTIHAPIYNITNTDANAIQATTKRYEEESIEIEEQSIFQKELMYWADASFNKRKQEQNAGKVIIEKLDKRPRKVVFLNQEDELCAKMRHNKFPNTEWQDLLRRVDLEVVKIQDVIKEYRITKLYDDADIFED
ncbi:hypothetical protein [Candidatus Deianiraea vastatrix]|uniref:Uncharacterized protein n=1 Tax=Candidatus Deianiraea vastatrix TaxID=2163644 RepID=A0A5B8XF79_9RICK|nr:hypothetical protein [Candidatus Deianiraea vastatrix]QED23920.1 hypothetical protein Deia_01139 [Candidatus Deianiraea vastatrix]